MEPKMIFVSVPLRGLWFLSSLKWFYIAGAGFAVSVPLRGLWFLSTWKRLRCATTTSSFRPLAGIMVLIVIPLSSNTFKNSSFRPLAGIMVLIKQGTKIPCLGTAGFPSPCGDYGSYHVRNVGNISKRTNSFPSPCGDYGSYQDEVFTKVQVDFGQFPSPCGDYGSYRHGTRSYCSFKLESFRPLAGIMVLIAKTASLITSAETLVSVPLRGLWFLSFKQAMAIVNSILNVSVPLRGLWFLSGREKVMRKEVYESFRPLAGIMVLIDDEKRSNQEIFE